MPNYDDVDQLVDGLDDIPTLMNRTKSAPASPRRFRGIPNYSHGVGQVMESHSDEGKYNKKMKWQASKVLSELAKMDDTKKAPKKRDLHEIAAIAKETMSKESTDRVVGRCDNIFKNYDLSRSGSVTYDDFQQALLAKNAGLSKKETIDLAIALDKNKTGVLEYSSLNHRLSDLQASSPRLKEPSTAQDSGSSNSYLDNYTKSNSPRGKGSDYTDYGQDYVIPEMDGYQRAFELGRLQAEERTRREQRTAANQTVHLEHRAYVDIPAGEMVYAHSCHLPPPAHDYSSPEKAFYRSSGRRPDWDTDKVKGLMHGPTSPRRGRSRSPMAALRTLTDDETTMSYTAAFMKSRGVRPEGSTDGRHITGVGALPGNKVELPKGDDAGGPVDASLRMNAANAANLKNQSSRAFLNSFVVDQAKPVRRKRRASSAPATGRSLSAYESSVGEPSPIKSDGSTSGKSLHSQLTRDISAHKKRMGTEEQKLEPTDDMVVLPYHQHFRSGGVDEALTKSDVPTSSSYVDKHGKKFGKGHCNRSMLADTRTASLQMSMNTLLSQVNSHSRVKVLQDKLNRIDISKSGYANKSELTHVLGKCGVHMTPEQIDSVFEANMHDGVGVAPGSESSLDLRSHRRGIKIDEFVQKLNVRSSAAAVQNKTKRGVSTSLRGTARKASANPNPTPIEIEDQVTWKKIIHALEDPHGVSKQSLQFFREAQAKHGNEVHPEQLREELNYVGAKLSETEFHNVLADVSRNPRGMIDVDDFTSELHRRSAENKAIEKWTALMPALEHSQESASPHSKSLSSIQKQTVRCSQDDNKRKYNQRKHFKEKFGEEAGKSSAREKSRMYASLLAEANGTKQEAPDQHIPACLRISNTKEYRQERLKWSKLRQTLVDNRDKLYQSFGGVKESSKKLSPQQVRDKLYTAGVMLGDDDFHLLCSYAATSSSSAALAASHGESKQSGDLNFDSLCESIGVSVDMDSRRKPVVASREDYDRDGGIFGASETSLLAHPTYRSSMLTSSIEDIPLVKGNRHRRYDLDSGKPLVPGATDVKPSDFWKFEHIQEIRSMPASNSRKSRSDDVNPTHKYQGTSLRQLQQDRAAGRQRSSSAPPRSSGSSASTASSRSYMWQKEERGNVPISRFASTPLAQYIAMRHQNTSMDTSSSRPLNPSDLNSSSIASSTTSYARNQQMSSEVDM